MALMEAALKRGHRVSMCAPSGQMSAASHRITLSDPLYVKDYPLNWENAEGFAITGTPADCVRLAFLGGLVAESVDGVISGINNGYNAGLATYYSGTVGAAREGARWAIWPLRPPLITSRSRCMCRMRRSWCWPCWKSTAKAAAGRLPGAEHQRA